MKTYYFLTIITFVVALVRGLKKGKKSGHTVFAFLGVALALFTFKIFGSLTHSLQVAGMGLPELLGQNLGSLLAMALSTSIAFCIYTALFMVVKFNKKDLLLEICSILITSIIFISSIQLTATLSNLDEKRELVAVSTKQAKATVTLNYD